jgi:predicted alpha/beta hydrolase
MVWLLLTVIGAGLLMVALICVGMLALSFWAGTELGRVLVGGSDETSSTYVE